MASPMSRTKSSVVPPDKGSFPIDHFKECDELVKKYLKCVQKHELMPKRCQNLQMEYLDCRMEKGLMTQESMENLGFTANNSIEKENDRKRELAEKFIKINQEAKQKVEEYYKDLYKS
jgi:cytochrome c oxidase assembly protein subunit 19